MSGQRIDIRPGSSSGLVGLGEAEASALFECLQKKDSSLSDAEVCRLYFVDVDVLADYVDGRCESISARWSSLFSLTRGLSIGLSPEPAAQDLADATSRAVSGFLLGRFRETRSIQNRRLWLTPEHSRELDGLIHAVLGEAGEAIGPWQARLFEEYSSLAESLSSGDKQEVDRLLDGIFKLLIVNSAAGKVARAYAVRRNMTMVPDQTPVFPPAGLARSFLLRTDSIGYAKHLKELEGATFQVMLDSVHRGQRSDRLWPAIERVLRVVFDSASPALGLRQQVDRVLNDAKLVALLPDNFANSEQWIRDSARMAALQVADVLAFAKIVAMSEWLAKEHPLASGAQWRVCLISGARKLQDLLAGLRKVERNGRVLGEYVEVIHPLSAMRFDEFLRPLQREKSVEVSPGDEYALSQLSGEQPAASGLEVSKFFLSLERVLSQASAGFAYRHDRSLAQLSRVLRSDEETHARVVRAVGNAVSSSYIQTFIQVNRLLPPGRNILPTASLPWVRLPLPGVGTSPADEFVLKLHEAASQKQNGGFSDMPVDLTPMLDSDPTGYTACVCAALGYLAMDREHLLSAETAANTAVRTSLISRNDKGSLQQYVPEGNEAMYLAAFISRMRVAPQFEHRRAAVEWRNNHKQTLVDARERLELWKREHGSLAKRSDSDTNMAATQLIEFRYDLEDTARSLFCRLIDLLCPGPSGPDADLLNEYSLPTLVERVSMLSERFSAIVVNKEAITKTGSELAFISSQLVLLQIQAWICLRVDEGADSSKSAPLVRVLQSVIERTLKTVDTQGSQLVRKLADLYLRNTGKVAIPPARGRSEQVDLVQFARIDEVRKSFLDRLERLPPGAPFCKAVLLST